jgi:site-specific DNA recombinase
VNTVLVSSSQLDNMTFSFSPPRAIARRPWTTPLRAFHKSRYTEDMSERKKYFLYARKSTDDTQRQVRSIDDQIVELKALARKHDIEIVDVYIEKQTAKVPGRPFFTEMLDRIEKGEATGILAWHPDRLARNSLDGGRIIYLLDTGMLVDLKFCTFWFENTPQGKLMLAIAFGMSKYYVDKLSEDIKRGLNGKLAEGRWPQFAPIGYLNDANTKTIVPDPVRGPLIRKAFELYANGDVTLDRLMASINGLGLTSRPCRKMNPERNRGGPLSRAQYHRLLRNPVYHGIIRYRGELFAGTHQPLISKELFDKVQAIAGGKRKPREKKLLKSFAYRGLFHCGECGGMITIELQKGHHYLRCTKKKGPCSQPYLREEEVTRQIDLRLGAIALLPDSLAWIGNELAATQADESAARERQLNLLRQQIATTDTKLARLTTAYTESVLDLDEYRVAKAKLVEERAALRSRTDRIDANPLAWLEPAGRFLNTLSEATLAWSSENPDDKAKFVRKTGSNLSIKERTLNVEFNEPLKIVEKHGRFAQPEPRASAADARVVGETHHVSLLAER